MTAAASLYQHLVTLPGIAALSGDRVYPISAPQRPHGEELQPTLVFRLSGRRDDLLLSGPRTLATSTWEIAVISADYDAGHELAEAVIAGLNYFKGRMGGPEGVYVEACALQDAADSDEPELGFHAVILQFELKYR
jgi:hypothetical protein